MTLTVIVTNLVPSDGSSLRTMPIMRSYLGALWEAGYFCDILNFMCQYSEVSDWELELLQRI